MNDSWVVGVCWEPHTLPHWLSLAQTPPPTPASYSAAQLQTGRDDGGRRVSVSIAPWAIPSFNTSSVLGSEKIEVIHFPLQPSDGTEKIPVPGGRGFLLPGSQ